MNNVNTKSKQVPINITIAMSGKTQFQSAKICAELTPYSSITTTQANVPTNDPKLSKYSLGIAFGHFSMQTGVGWVIFRALIDDDM